MSDDRELENVRRHESQWLLQKALDRFPNSGDCAETRPCILCVKKRKAHIDNCKRWGQALQRLKNAVVEKSTQLRAALQRGAPRTLRQSPRDVCRRRGVGWGCSRPINVDRDHSLETESRVTERGVAPAAKDSASPFPPHSLSLSLTLSLTLTLAQAEGDRRPDDRGVARHDARGAAGVVPREREGLPRRRFPGVFLKRDVVAVCVSTLSHDRKWRRRSCCAFCGRTSDSSSLGSKSRFCPESSREDA